MAPQSPGHLQGFEPSRGIPEDSYAPVSSSPSTRQSWGPVTPTAFYLLQSTCLMSLPSHSPVPFVRMCPPLSWGCVPGRAKDRCPRAFADPPFLRSCTQWVAGDRAVRSLEEAEGLPVASCVPAQLVSVPARLDWHTQCCQCLEPCIDLYYLKSQLPKSLESVERITLRSCIRLIRLANY